MSKEPNLDILGNFAVKNFLNHKLPSLDQLQQVVQISGTRGYSGVPRALDQSTGESQKSAVNREVENTSELVLPVKSTRKRKAGKEMETSSVVKPRVQEQSEPQDSVPALMNRATRMIFGGYRSLLLSLSEQFTTLDELGLFCRLLRDIIFAFFLSSSQTGDVMTKASFSKHIAELSNLFRIQSLAVANNLHKFLLGLFDDFALQEVLYFLQLSVVIIRTRPSTTNSSTIPSNEAAFALDQLSQLPIMHRIKRIQQLQQNLPTNTFNEVFHSPSLCKTTITSDQEKLILGRSEHICRFDINFKSYQTIIDNTVKAIESRYCQQANTNTVPAPVQGPGSSQATVRSAPIMMDLTSEPSPREQQVERQDQPEQRQALSQVLSQPSSSMPEQNDQTVVPVSKRASPQQSVGIQAIGNLDPQLSSRPSSSSSSQAPAPNHWLLPPLQSSPRQSEMQVASSTQSLPTVVIQEQLAMQAQDVPAVAVPQFASQVPKQPLFLHEPKTTGQFKKKGYAALPQMSPDHEPELDLVSEDEEAATVHSQKRSLPSLSGTLPTPESTVHMADSDDLEPPSKQRRVDDVENTSIAETEVPTTPPASIAGTEVPTPLQEVTIIDHKDTRMDVVEPPARDSTAHATISEAPSMIETAMDVEKEPEPVSSAVAIQEEDEDENHMFQDFIDEIYRMATREEKKEKMILKLNELRNMLNAPDFDTPEAKANLEKGFKQFNTLTPADCFTSRGKIRPFFDKVISRRASRSKAIEKVVPAAEMLPKTSAAEPPVAPPVAQHSMPPLEENFETESENIIEAQQVTATQQPLLPKSPERTIAETAVVTSPRMVAKPVGIKTKPQKTANSFVIYSLTAAEMTEGAELVADEGSRRESSSAASSVIQQPQPAHSSERSQPEHLSQIQQASMQSKEGTMTVDSNERKVVDLLDSASPLQAKEISTSASVPLAPVDTLAMPVSSSSQFTIKDVSTKPLTEIERRALVAATSKEKSLRKEPIIQATFNHSPKLPSKQSSMQAPQAVLGTNNQSTQGSAPRPPVVNSSPTTTARPNVNPLIQPPSPLRAAVVSSGSSKEGGRERSLSAKSGKVDEMPPPARGPTVSNKSASVLSAVGSSTTEQASEVSLTQASGSQDLSTQSQSSGKKRRVDGESDKVNLTLLCPGLPASTVKVKRGKTIGELFDRCREKFTSLPVRGLQHKGRDLPSLSTIGDLGLQDGDELTVSVHGEKDTK